MTGTEATRKLEVTLREITDETVLDVCGLSETLTKQQRYFVADNAISFAQAYYYPFSWLRAIYTGKTLVGFIFLADNHERPIYILIRFMIARLHQGKGYARKALEQVIDYVRTRPGASELRTSCYLGEGSPEGFYRKLGFKRTGEEVSSNEVELILEL